MEAKVLRARARASLQGNWGLSIGVAAIAALLGAMLTGNSFLPQVRIDLPFPVPFLDELNELIKQGVAMGSFRIGISSGISGLAVTILGGVVQLGYAKYLLAQQDGKPLEFNMLFSEFDRFGTGFAQRFLRILYVGLWSLLLVIPGIVKSYSYSMTTFILAEHPELTASEAINRSKLMMEGHKMDLFILDLTFIGWIFLAALPASLGFVLLNPYTNAAHAAFYRQLQAENRYL